MRAPWCPKEILQDVKRLLTLAAALAVASAGLLIPVTTVGQTMPTGEPTPPPKENCSSKMSKWQQKKCQDYNNAAPGDEYFGRMKMSYLGINNTFKDMAVESGDNTTNQAIINKLNFAEEALAKWAGKYPKDPDLARSYYLGVLALKKVYVQQQQQLAWQYAQTIVKHFPNTFFSRQMAAMIKAGFVEHWYADAQPCPAPGADPPAPTPAPSPKPGQVAVDILNPPCIESSSQQPGLTAAPTPGPTQHPRNAAAATATNPAASPNPKPGGTPVPGPNPHPPLR
jgi:hypothetical protein